MKSAFAVTALVFAAASLEAGEALPTRETSLYGAAAEWIVENPTWTGNPFDLHARAVFNHEGGTTIGAPLFYAGPGTSNWVIRFTGTLPGTWTFTTSSEDPDLAGHRGRVQVADDPDALGFVVAAGNQWAQQRGRDGLRPLLPQLVMIHTDPMVYAAGDRIDREIDAFLGRHGFTGFHLPSVAGQWFDASAAGDTRTHPRMENPDPRTFAALERLIRKTHAAGGMVHIWAWGDTQRSLTPDTLRGGKNGEVDQRLQRYIAARLGPLPGWTMGYGFDLNEWAGASREPSRVKDWADRINRGSGWPHLLGGRSDGPNSNQPFALDVFWNTHFGYAGYEHHEPTYEDLVAAMQAAHQGVPLERPVMSEDRFRIRNRGAGKDYTAEQTRRGLWHAAMAGGVACIWGTLDDSDGYWSAPYLNADQIKTWNRFWLEHGRFRLGMKPAADLAADANVLADDQGLVAYREGAAAMRLYLPGPLRITAVDTTLPYREIDLGVMEGAAVVKLPSSSDWALAVTPVRREQ